MWDTLSWVYMITATLVINHEIDSAYWREWDLFHLPGGISGFLIIHLPLVFLILYGIVLVSQRAFGGLVLSLILSVGGIAAFVIHVILMKLGHPEFKTPMSLLILTAGLISSLVQAGLTLHLLGRL